MTKWLGNKRQVTEASRQRDDRFAMKRHQRVRRHDQAAIRSMRECSNRGLNFAGVARINRAQLHPKRRCHSLDRGKLADTCGKRGGSKDPHSRHAGRDLFEQFKPFCAHAIFKLGKSSRVPPGRAKLSTNPPPTG